MQERLSTRRRTVLTAIVSAGAVCLLTRLAPSTDTHRRAAHMHDTPAHARVMEATASGAGNEASPSGVDPRSEVHQKRCAALRAAVQQHLFDDRHLSLVFHDMDAVAHSAAFIQRCAGYPPNALHTIAVKANPVGKILEVFRDAGSGAEVASLGELEQALKVGFSPSKIVLDSPAKTKLELKRALQSGVNINVDNFQELDRLAAQLEKTENSGFAPGQTIGLRINPQVGSGSIAALSTAAKISKFGVPLQECKSEILNAFARYPFLNALHVHVGSQGIGLELQMKGIQAVWSLRQEIDSFCGESRICSFDIGGGLTVDYGTDAIPSTGQYTLQASMMKDRLPELYETGAPRLVTENGRAHLAKSAFAASRVEYVKVCGGRHIAVTHLGADLLIRTCLLPEVWPLRVAVCNSSGYSKENMGNQTDGWRHVDVVGPLCFQGDRIAENRWLPMIESDDLVLVLDVGAYTLSMFSRYNSRAAPAVYGYKEVQGCVHLTVLKSGEGIDNVLKFFN